MLLVRTAHQFVLPVIIATADDQVLLRPDDLRPDREPLPLQARGNGRGVKRFMPDVNDAAAEQRPRIGPTGASVVLNLAGS